MLTFVVIFNATLPFGGAACFCLCLFLFLAFLVAWRAMRLRWNFEGEIGMGGTPSSPRREAGFTRSTRRAWPCSRYDVDCVVEEWSYY